MAPILLSVFLIPTLSIPFVYLTGKKSAKAAAIFVSLIALVSILLILTTVPTILNSATHQYTESYTWISGITTSFTLFTDGISASIALISLSLIFTASLFSIKYMAGKENLPAYYTLLCMLSIGSVGVFLTSNLILFYFCWELMLVPAYFIIGEWGSGNSYKSAFKFFIYTHIGAVFVLLGIGATYIATGSTDMFQAQAGLVTASPILVKWILIALTAGFAVKMAVIPFHLWLPDSYSDAPAPMSALLGGVLSSAGAYAILRLSLGMVFPAVGLTFGTDFLYALSIIGVLSAFFGSFMSLVSTDMKRVIAYSSISHMGYIMFGFSLFPVSVLAGTSVLLASAIAISGTVLHIITHSISKGLLFLGAGGVESQTEERDMGKMGGLASKMPFTAVSSTIAALSIGGVPPFACFISEFLIFVGAFQVIGNSGGGFYIVPTALMLLATVLSIAYMLRFTSNVFLGRSKDEEGETPAEGKSERKVVDVSNYMKFSFVILVVLIVLIGIYPTFFLNLINTVRLG
ncbi:MAG TPA: NADH-quinone oxidoreductase subunit M [Candidatus Limnocylindrales bacterium]|nr:NADH-quinone oxidoreductase subunit M [Candidatus Limnocylindrales bacterium]